MATPSEHEGSALTRVLALVIAAALRRRGLALASVALVVIVAALGLARLRVDFSSTAFYGDGDEPGRRLAEFQDRWGADDDALLILVHPRAERDEAGVLTGERLAAIAELARALEGGEAVARVSSIATTPLPRPRIGVGPLEATTLPELVEPLGLDDPARRRAALERLPFVPTLLAADGRATVIVVKLGFSSDDVRRTRAAVAALEPILAAHDPALAELGLERELAGVPALRAGFFTALVRDQAIFVPLTFTIIGLALWLVFRRIHGVIIPALAAAIPTVTLVGIMAWVDEPIGLLNQAYFTLLPVILVADAIHMLARYHEERRSGADDGPAELDAHGRAIVRAGSRVGLACLLTSITTAAGFASLGVATMPILRGFGLFAALGVGLGFLMVVILVPLLLSFVDPRREPVELPGLAIIDAIVRLATRRPGFVVLASVALIGAALVLARGVVVDNRLSNLLDDDHPTTGASGRVDAELGGVLGLEFELEGAGDLREPATLAAIHGFERWLADQPEVRAVEGLAGIVASAGPLFGAPPTIPGEREAIDARLAALAEFVPLDRHMKADGEILRIHAGLPDAGGRGFVDFAARAEAELERRLEGREITVHATGTALLAYRGVNRITAELRASFALVFVIVVALIGLLFRSAWPALIAVIPNGLPLLLGYATIGLLGEVLDPLAAVILTLALGIAVDDTLHVLVRTREELGRDNDLELALRRAIAHSGRAVAVTSIVIAGALALNLGSSFPPLQMLGLLGAIVIVLALIADLSILPALVVIARGRGLRARR